MKHLFDKYWLDTDKLNYIIMEEKVYGVDSPKKGGKYYTIAPQAYHGSITSLVRSLKERCVREAITSRESVDMIKELSEINKYIHDNDIMSVSKGELR